MRTTLDLPDAILKKAKMNAIAENIALKELIIRSLENELHGAGSVTHKTKAPWKKLKNQGSVYPG